MFIVTGGAGFIGSNLVAALNQGGSDDIIVVDNLSDGHKFRNLAGARIADYMDHTEFRARLAAGDSFGRVKAVFHQGACSDTTEWDGQYMLDTNFTFSKEVFHWCQGHGVPLVYASSAAVYGASTAFEENQSDLRPLNVYGWSKLLFDQWIEKRGADLAARVVGLRYFNVYGPREGHKGRMASVVQHFSRQVEDGGTIKVFAGSLGFGDGEHRRDFVFVNDVARINLWAWQTSTANGVYNVGTGQARTFNDVANAVIGFHGKGTIEYIPFPEDLKGAYQPVTEAAIDRLRSAGYDAAFTGIEAGVAKTLGQNAQLD